MIGGGGWGGATTLVVAAEGPEGHGSINHSARIIGVFFSPKSTFEDIAQRPSWILPVILMTVLGGMVAFVMNQKVDWRDVATKRIEESSRSANLSAEQKSQQIEMSAKISPGIAYGFGMAWPILQALIVGSVLLLAYNVLGGGDTKFGAAMGITAHAYFPWILYSMLFGLILYLKAPGTVALENPISTNVGAFLPESTPKALMSLGKSIDVFTVWTLLLISIGFTATNPKKLRGKGLTIVIPVWPAYFAAH